MFIARGYRNVYIETAREQFINQLHKQENLIPLSKRAPGHKNKIRKVHDLPSETFHNSMQYAKTRLHHPHSKSSKKVSENRNISYVNNIIIGRWLGCRRRQTRPKFKFSTLGEGGKTPVEVAVF